MLHIVRKFGCSGGMEKYVWVLAHQLVKQGVKTEILCDEVTGIPDPAIVVHKIEFSERKPRWKSMLRFRSLVDTFITLELSKRKVIVHSHERSLNHHVTTFHGPPMLCDKWYARVPLLNRRVKAWQSMECDELLRPSVQRILPVSKVIQDRLLSLYPSIKPNEMIIAWPGTDDRFVSSDSLNRKNTSALHCLFVGKEWKRKGLDTAVAVVSALAENREATLDVYGPSVSELPKSIVKSRYTRIRGWQDSIPWTDYHILIHPARNEPFGMVVAEARSKGVPVLTSDITGSVGLNYRGVAACPAAAPIDVWVQQLLDLIDTPSVFQPEVLWSWADLARLHIDHVYSGVKF